MTVETDNPSAAVKDKETEKRCPVCQKETVHAYRPFCSKRCKMVDLYKWVSGHYVIPGSLENVMSQEEQEAQKEWKDAWKKDDF